MKKFVKLRIHKLILIIACAVLLFSVHLGYSIITSNLAVGGNAKLKQGQVVVTFNANGGSVSTTSATYKSNSTYNTLPTSTRSNYRFDGWYTEATGGSLVSNTTNIINTSNHTLYAHWTFACAYSLNTVWNYPYNTNKTYYTFTTPCDGTYKFETWGASGNSATYNNQPGTLYAAGKGAYAAGNLYLVKTTPLYIFVGGVGGDLNPGYNGGSYSHAGGGGSTDIRTVSGTYDTVASLRSRIMVAAGGGGGFDRTEGYGGGPGGDGGTLVGYNGSSLNHTLAYGYGYGLGGQTNTGGLFYWENLGAPIELATGYQSTNKGAFGGGGNEYANQAGGGSGWYGGSGAAHGGAGGGSSFISGYPGCNAVDINGNHTNSPNSYTGYIFTSYSMIAGNAYMPNHSAANSMIGNTGNGYARITLVSYT